MTTFAVVGYLAGQQDGRECFSQQVLACECGALVLAGESQMRHQRWHEQEPL